MSDAAHDLSCPCGSGRPAQGCCVDPRRSAGRLDEERARLWAAELGIRDQLASLAFELPGHPMPPRSALPWLAKWVTVEELLVDVDARMAPPTRELEAARRAAFAYLARTAEAVRRGREEEARPRPPPATRALAALSAQLLALRAPLRAAAAPRALALVPGHGLTVLHEVRALRYVEGGRIRGRYGGPDGVGVTVNLSADGDRPPAPPTCSCRATGPCGHALAAVDLALHAVHDPAPHPQVVALAEVLAVPAWSRALDALAAHGAPAGEGATPAIQLSFVLEPRVAGPFVLRIRRQERRRDGGWGPPRSLREEDLDPGLPLAPEDRLALDRLELDDGAGSSFYGRPRIGEGLSDEHAAALVGHPRVFLKGYDRPVAVRRLPLGLAVTPLTDGRWRLCPAAGAEPIGREEVERGLRWTASRSFLRVSAEPGHLQLVEVRHPRTVRALLQALSRHGDTFPAEAAGQLLDRLEALTHLLPIEVPAELAGVERPPEVHLVLKVWVRPAGVELEALARPIEGGPLLTAGAGASRAVAAGPGGRISCRRDLDAERALAAGVLAALPLAGAVELAPGRLALRDDARALELVVALQALRRPDVTLAWGDAPPRVLRSGGAAPLQVKVRDRGDWFGVSGEVEVDGERVELAVILEALREQRTVVRLSGGGWLALGGLLAERLAPLAQLSTAGPGGVEIGPAALGALEDLHREGAELDAEGRFARLHGSMLAAGRRTPRLPRAFKGKLRDYQLEGFRWLARLADWGAGAVLADDMGLGKTLQALALLCHRAAEGPALVVAPTSVCSNWVAEAARFAPGLRVHLFRDADRAAAVAALGPGDVLVASYGLLTLDLERFRGVRFATLVLDEAQAVKNATTRRARAARDLNAGFRVALSGTPVENHLGELWSIYRVVFPGLLGSWPLFRDRFAAPIERDGDEGRRRALSATVRPFLLRRTKAEVARELPTRTEIALPVVLGPAERRHYDEVRLAALSRLERERRELQPAQRRFQVLAAITRLRLLACHPRLHDPASRLESAKLARFVALAGELAEGGHRALVFSQFTSHLALVRRALDEAGLGHLYLDGETAPRARDELVRRFLAGEAPFFLISLKAGGTGLNLTAADYVIHLDPWWNPAVEDQATDRAHRIGQRRPVTVYRLVAAGTIEEAILALHGRKRALVEGLLGGMERAGKLSADELLALVREGAGGAGGGGGSTEVDAAAAALERTMAPDPEAAEDVAEWSRRPRRPRGAG